MKSLQGGADVVASVGIGAIELVRPHPIRDRLLEPPKGVQKHRPHVERGGMVWSQLVAGPETG
jgi:hypothetical protein